MFSYLLSRNIQVIWKIIYLKLLNYCISIFRAIHRKTSNIKDLNPYSNFSVIAKQTIYLSTKVEECIQNKKYNHYNSVFLLVPMTNEPTDEIQIGRK